MSWHVRSRCLALLGVGLAAALAFGAPSVAAADETGPAVTAVPSAGEPAPAQTTPASTATPTGESSATPTPTFNPASEPDPAPAPDPTTEPAPVELSILTSALAEAYWGRPYSAALSASGSGALVWSLTGGQLPAGLTLSPGGAVTGTPTSTGTFSVQVSVLDGAAVAATRTLLLVVTAALDAGVSEVSADLVRYSYRPGCPIKPSGLRHLQMNYWGYDGSPHRGDLVLRANAVDATRSVFAKAFTDKFAIHRMNLVEKYQASDVKAMKDDNTSAFNCRHVTGNPTRLSQHSYGDAIDINTVRNPYVTKGKVYPAAGKKYLDRSPLRTGMIGRSSVIARAFAQELWKWGARWSRPDYQHFSANGG